MRASKSKSKCRKTKDNPKTKPDTSASSNDTANTNKYRLRFPPALNLGIYPRKNDGYVFSIKRNKIQSNDLMYDMKEWTESIVNSNKDINDECQQRNQLKPKYLWHK